MIMTQNNLIVKPIIWALLLLNLEVLTIHAQEKWFRLDNMHKMQIEDLVMSKSGIIYSAVYGRNIILESMDQGQSWNSIILDTFKYYASNMHKRLLIDHQDSLIEFFFWSGVPGARKVNGQTFKYINPSESAIVGITGSKIKFDDSGNYYYNYINELYQYTKIFSQTKLIFKTQDEIVNYFMYSDSINYIITRESSTLNYNIYKLNTRTEELSKLNILQVGNNPYSILITRNGTILIPTLTGLYKSIDEGKNFDRVEYDSLKSPYANIKHLYFTQDEGLIVEADESFYFSKTDGNSWIPINAFSKDYPGNIREQSVIVSDTNYAVILGIDSCDNQVGYYISPHNLKWEEFDFGLSTLDMSFVTKDNKKTLFARPNKCSGTLYSDNEARNWHEFLINNERIDALIQSNERIFFSISMDQTKLFRSLDQTKSWQEFPISNFGTDVNIFTNIWYFNNKSWGLGTGVKNQFGTGYTLKSIQFTKDNGESWQKIPSKYYPYIGQIIDDQNGNLLSCNFTFNKVYSSTDFGQTWEIDERFNDFSKVIEIGKNQFGGFLVSGIYKGVINIYLSYDFINFVPVNGNFFKTQFSHLYELGENMVAAFVYGEGIFLSRDGGMNWEDFTDGLDIFRTDICYLNSLFSDSENHVYASIQYDGLYKTVKPLVSDNVSVLSNEISIFPNPFNEYLIVKSNLDHRSSIELFDAQGRLIVKEDLKQEYHTIRLDEDLPQGIYIYKLISDNKSLSVGKLFKG